MNSVIAALRVNLGLDSAQFETGSKRVQQSAKGMSAGVKAAFIAVGAAAAAATAAFGLALKGQIDSADALSKSAQSIGVAVEELSAFRYAADLSGISAESLDSSVGRLARAMNDMAQGTSSAATDALGRLGISATNAAGELRSPRDVMADIAERFAGMENGAAKTALAIEIFGRSGAALIPLLNSGKDGLAEMAAEAERLGLVISTDTALAAEVFNDNLTRLQAAGQGLVNGAMAALLPALVAVSGAMVALSQSGNGIAGAFAEVGRYASVAGAAFAAYFGPALVASLGAVSTAVGTTLVGAVRALTVAMMANPMGLLVAGIAAAVTAAFMFRDEIKQIIGVDVVEVFRTGANLVIQSFDLAFRNIGTIWSALPAVLGDITISTANAVISGIEQMINGAIGLINDFTKGAREALGAIGLEVGEIGGVEMGGFENKFSGSLGGVGAALAQNLSDTSGIDYVGQMTSALGSMWTTAEGATAAFAGLNSELGAGGAGAGGGGGTKAALTGAKDATNQLTDAMKEAEQFGKSVTSTLSSGFADMFKGLITGSQSAMDSIGQLIGKLGDMFLNQGFNMLFGAIGGGMGNFFNAGGPLRLGYNLPGFANGTNFAPGGMALVGERGPEIVNLPRGSQVVPNNQLRGGGHITFDGTFRVENGELIPVMTQVAGQVAGQQIKQNNKQLPGLMRDANQRYG